MTVRPPRSRVLRGLVVATLIVLTTQGWFGDTANIFLMPANGVPPPRGALAGFVAAVTSLRPPFVLVGHAILGVALVTLAFSVFLGSLALSHSRGVRAWSALGLLATLSAALGGYWFVMSGFADGGNSAQMGGSFIGAYACYFMAFYYTK